MKKHKVVERGEVLYIIGPREGHTWFDHVGMWPVCEIDNYVFWDDPAIEAIDRENARKICNAMNVGETK